MRQQSEKIIVEIWKDGSRVKPIDFGGDRAGARTIAVTSAEPEPEAKGERAPSPMQGTPKSASKAKRDWMRPTAFFAMLNRPGPGKPVLTVNGQELRAADAVKFLKTGRSKRGAALALD